MEIIPKNPFAYPSVFKEIARILREAAFQDTLKEASHDEEVIRTMTKAEAAVFTIINQLEDEYAEKFLHFLNMKGRKMISTNEEAVGQFDLDVNQMRTILLRGLLTLLVNDRIGWEETAAGVDFRKGFKIVKTKDKDGGQQLMVSFKLGSRA